MPGGNNPQNLAPPIRSGEEAREKGRAGGVASGKSRRAKKALREIARDLLDRSVNDEEILDRMEALGIVKPAGKNGKRKKCKMIDAMIGGQIEAAIGGDARAFKALTELAEPGAYDPKYSRDPDEDESMTGVVELGAVLDPEIPPEEDETDT